MSIYNMKIKTLSPIHIGDGSQYDGMTLLDHQGYFYPVDFKILYQAFKENEVSFDEFKKWVEDNKGFRFQRKPILSEFFVDKCANKKHKITDVIVKNSSLRIENLCQSRPNTDIECCLKNVHQRPYIPGSELKGAMVTAIMHHFLKDDVDFYQDLEKLLNKYSAFLDQLYASMKKVKQLQQKKKDEGFHYFKQMDFQRRDWKKVRRIFSMRERQISQIEKDLKYQLDYPDSEVKRIISILKTWRNAKQQINQEIWQEKQKYDKKRIGWISNEIFEIEDKYWEKYLMTREKNRSIGSKVMRFLRIGDTNTNGSSKISHCWIIHSDPNITMNLYYEIIDSDSAYAADLQLDMQKVIWDHFTFRDESKQVLDHETLFQWIHDFSREVLQEDIEFFKHLDETKQYRFSTNKIKAQLEGLVAQNSPQEPLLRIGKAQGFLSLTLASMVKKHDRQNGTDIYRKLLGVVQSDKNNPDFYPTTRRIIADSSGDYRLPGWIKISLESKEELCKS
jgi:CRISPR type III-A-associated RAMP protein Csm5